MVRVSIDYCAPCRLAAEAVATERALVDRLRKYDEIKEVSLTLSGETLITVIVDGEAIWSVDVDGRVDTIEAVAAVRSRLRS